MSTASTNVTKTSILKTVDTYVNANDNDNDVAVSQQFVVGLAVPVVNNALALPRQQYTGVRNLDQRDERKAELNSNPFGSSTNGNSVFSLRIGMAHQPKWKVCRKR